MRGGFLWCKLNAQLVGRASEILHHSLTVALFIPVLCGHAQGLGGIGVDQGQGLLEGKQVLVAPTEPQVFSARGPTGSAGWIANAKSAQSAIAF